MSYITSHLLDDEQVIFQTKLHWVTFMQPLVWLLAGVAIYSVEPHMPLLTVIPLLMAIGTGLSSAVNFACSEFGITNKRVLIKVGFISINSIETLLSKIESIQVHQSIAGRLLGYGTIIICGTGGTRDSFSGIDNPLQFRRLVQEQIDKLG